jgi:hypothetical protein
VSKSLAKKEVNAESEKFADLYRDIRGQFLKAQGKLHKVVLRHVRMGGKDGGSGDSDVSQWEADHFEGKDPNEFTTEVIADIMEDAKIFPPSTQRYGIFFWHKNTTSHQHRIFALVQGGGPGEGGDVFSSEGPDLEGRTSQLMRHDEGYTRLALQAIANTLNSKDKQIDQLSQMNQALMGQLVPTLTTIQDILDRTAERDFNLMRKKKMYDLIDMAGEKAMQVVPFILAHAMKDKSPDFSAMIMKSVSNPANDIFKMFMASVEQIDADKRGAIFAAFQALPNGQAILQGLAQLDAMNKAEAQREAEKKKEKEEKEKQDKQNGSS